jgi:hypothetical protein
MRLPMVREQAARLLCIVTPFRRQINRHKAADFGIGVRVRQGDLTENLNAAVADVCHWSVFS